MKTSRKLPLLAILLIILISSCSTVDDAIQLPDRFQERTDIVVTGDVTMETYAMSDEADAATDLVSFNYYGNPSENFDFMIQLGSGSSLLIQVHDAQNLNPWEQINLPYNIYPGQDLEDKLYYTNITFNNADGSCGYSTNFTDNIPPGTFIDVFKITKNDGDQIQCRIRDMKLYKTSDTDKTITINGTFIGAVTFE